MLDKKVWPFDNWGDKTDKLIKQVDIKTNKILTQKIR